MSAHLEKATMNSLEMDREVIRCKTCGLVQYRTRTGNCRRCVRALPQRLEFLIPEAEPEAQAGAEPVSDKFANQKTVENIGQRIRQLRVGHWRRHLRSPTRRASPGGGTVDTPAVRFSHSRIGGRWAAMQPSAQHIFFSVAVC